MRKKKTYAELFDANKLLANRIQNLNQKMGENNTEMQKLCNQRINEIQDGFWKEKSHLKIEISTFFDFAVIGKLAEQCPIAFTEKYLNQYKIKPECIRFGKTLTYDVMIERSSRKRVFNASCVYNAPLNSFATAVRGIRITAVENDGGEYDRNWCDASITLYFNGQTKELNYSNNQIATQIYISMRKYNNAYYKTR